MKFYLSLFCVMSGMLLVVFYGKESIMGDNLYVKTMSKKQAESILTEFFLDGSYPLIETMLNEQVNLIDTSEEDGLFDARSAVELAIVYLVDIYGADKATLAPYSAGLYNGMWIIKGSLARKGKSYRVFGGSPYLVIRQTDGELLGYTHTR